MAQSQFLLGDQVSTDPDGNPQLVITSLRAGTPEEELQIDIMNRPEAVGSENVAYLIFGTPGTNSYSFMDLNDLPNDVKVCITVVRGETEISKSEFAGKSGNMPVVG